jgi:inhibitor of cysteine peptidase
VQGDSPMKKTLWRQAALIAMVLVMLSVLTVEAKNRVNKPLRVRSYRHLEKIFEMHRPQYIYGYRGGDLPLGMVARMNAMTAMVDASTNQANGSFSSTLVQVQGVDEGDIVKNDGQFIYQLNQNRVLVINSIPNTAPFVQQILTFEDEAFWPQELYLDDMTLTAIGSSFRPQVNTKVDDKAIPWVLGCTTVKAIVFDITDKSNIRKTREIEIEGDYIASRKVGGNLYLVARRYPDYYALNGIRSPNKADFVPSFRDSARKKGFVPLSAHKILYLPDFDEPNYLVVAGVNVNLPDSQLHIEAILGAGEQIYASLQNLYVTASRYPPVFTLPLPRIVPNLPAVATDALLVLESPTNSDVLPPESDEHTTLYRFALNNSQILFKATGEVPGSVLNQYSMDEHEGYFRVTTTQHGWWTGGDDFNNLYVLNEDLQLVGKVEDIAPGERIYAARFLGDRCFLVTFENIDPLFAIDLTNPAKPIVVGELILPGYSQFLLPYDENHLIGIGKDVIVADGFDGGDVPWWNGIAFYQGMKLALFDVNDLHNPLLVQSVSIGDRGTDSPALFNPHAILFDRTKGLFALPIALAEIPNKDANTPPWQWGEYTFQGLYVFNVSPSGFVLKDTITHKSPGEEFWQSYSKTIERSLFIDDGLFTLSEALLKVNDLNSLVESATLPLPQPSGLVYPWEGMTLKTLAP